MDKTIQTLDALAQKMQGLGSPKPMPNVVVSEKKPQDGHGFLVSQDAQNGPWAGKMLVHPLDFQPLQELMRRRGTGFLEVARHPDGAVEYAPTLLTVEASRAEGA